MLPFPLLREHSLDVCLVTLNYSTECFCLNRQVRPLCFRVAANTEESGKNSTKKRTCSIAQMQIEF